MPTSPPTRCADPACTAFATDGHGRCDTHTKPPWVKNRDAWAAVSSHRWSATRRAHLHDEPFCRACGTVAEEVDHITPLAAGGATWDRANLQSLCVACHKAKTQNDSRRGRNRRRQ